MFRGCLGGVRGYQGLRRVCCFAETAQVELKVDGCKPLPGLLWRLTGSPSYMKVVAINPSQAAALRFVPVSLLSLTRNSTHARRRASGPMAAAAVAEGGGPYCKAAASARVVVCHPVRVVQRFRSARWISSQTRLLDQRDDGRTGSRPLAMPPWLRALTKVHPPNLNPLLLVSSRTPDCLTA